MKKIFFVIALFISVLSVAQKQKKPGKARPVAKTLEIIPRADSTNADTTIVINYWDSTISLILTQRAAIYIGQSIKKTFDWKNRSAPDKLKTYIGSGTNYDSVLGVVTLKSSLIKGMVDLLFDLPESMVEKDKLSIINNTPAVPQYIALQNQLNQKANGSSGEKDVSIFLRDYLLQRVNFYIGLRLGGITEVVEWANN